MKSPNVCTEAANRGRIVSSNPKALGASTSSRRIRRKENHFIFAVGTKHHISDMHLHGSKMFTLHLQVLDLTLINLIYSLTERSNFGIRNRLGTLDIGVYPTLSAFNFPFASDFSQQLCPLLTQST